MRNRTREEKEKKRKASTCPFQYPMYPADSVKALDWINVL
jgi:hypothetical protein